MDKKDEVIQARKPAASHPVIKEIAARFSPRHFDGVPVPQTDLDAMFEAARWAPSSYNVQPWDFYFAEHGSVMFDKLLTALSSGNTWAKTAGNLIVACYEEKTKHGINTSAKYDLGLAAMSLVLQAQSMGYFTHQMGGIDKEKIREILQLGSNIIPHVVIALGRIGDYTLADPELLKRDMTPTTRKTDLARKI